MYPGPAEANTFHSTIHHPNLELAFQLICPAFKAKENSISRFSVLIKSHIPKLVPRQRNGILHREISDHFVVRTASSQQSPVENRSTSFYLPPPTPFANKFSWASVAQNKIKILIYQILHPTGCWWVRGWGLLFPIRNYRCIMPLFPVPNLC